MFAFAVPSLNNHPISFSKGEEHSAPFSPGEGLGMRPGPIEVIMTSYSLIFRIDIQQKNKIQEGC